MICQNCGRRSTDSQPLFNEQGQVVAYFTPKTCHACRGLARERTRRAYLNARHAENNELRQGINELNTRFNERYPERTPISMMPLNVIPNPPSEPAYTDEDIHRIRRQSAGYIVCIRPNTTGGMQ